MLAICLLVYNPFCMLVVIQLKYKKRRRETNYWILNLHTEMQQLLCRLLNSVAVEEINYNCVFSEVAAVHMWLLGTF